MTTKRVLILTEAKLETGLGHLTRCQALVSAFEKQGVGTEIWLNSDEAVQAKFQHPAIRHVDWLAMTDLIESIGGYETVVVDSYLATNKLLLEIASHVQNPVFLDDTVRMDYKRGKVLNGALGAELLEYPVNPSVQYLLGYKHAIFREAFWNAPQFEVRETIDRILLAFGSADPMKLMPKAIKIVQEAISSARIEVVLGLEVLHQNEVAEMADGNTFLHIGISPEGMRDLMLSSDLIVTAAGQTLQEAIHIGLPAVAVQTAGNQSLSYNFLMIENLISDKLGIESFCELKKIITDHKPFDKRIKISQNIDKYKKFIGELSEISSLLI
jgi:UDP-2,4-diacetamido-2,4,6-trideoxy-beta-L-altropyranose hydrolase